MRYYFHIRIDGDLIRDVEGIEFENDELAREEATKSATELMREYPRGETPRKPQLISVANEMGNELFVVPITQRCAPRRQAPWGGPT